MSYYEERHWREHNKATRWLTKYLLWTAFWTILTGILSLPLAYLIVGGFSDASLEQVGNYFSRLLHQPIHALVMFFAWIIDVFSLDIKHWGFYLPFLTFVVLMYGIYYSVVKNPFYFGPTFFGSGRWANDADIQKMKLLSGKYMFLGRWKGKDLKLPDIFSTLCIASPGCGKTVSVVVPSILETQGTSMLINDPKGEVFDLTSGYRAKLGPVFKIYWEGRDDPEKGLYWPRWNPMGPINMPARQYDRAGYIEGMAASMIPDGPEGTDPYWITAGRSAFVGFILYIADKVEQALANDYFLSRLYEDGLDDEDYEVLESYYITMEKTKEVMAALRNTRKHKITLDNYLAVGTWRDMPKMWVGRESCLPMVIDWMTSVQMRYSVELKDRRESGDIAAYSIDPWDIILTDAMREGTYFGYGHRTLLELHDLLVMPSSQRASVLSTAISGLSVFKNGAVRARTASSDFVNRYNRGWKNPVTGEWEPVTVYLSIPLMDISSTATISTLFLCNQMIYMGIFPPNVLGHGPFPVLFVLDELQSLPTIGLLQDSVSGGRFQNASYLLVFQDLSQISAKYGEDAVNVLITNTAAKICLGTNNDETAHRFDSLIAKKTVKTKKVSQSEGLGSSWSSPFVRNVSFGYDRDSLMGTVGFVNMPEDKQLVLFQRYLNRPISAERVPFYKDKKMLKKTQIPPAPPMPKYILDARSPEEMDPPISMEVEGIKDTKNADLDEENRAGDDE